MTPHDFIAKWQRVTLTERSACQQHFLDLCELLGQPKPATADPEGTWYTFERGVTKTAGGHGWADVWCRERTLDPAKRSQIGAHYTSRDDILTLLEPVMMTPLRRVNPLYPSIHPSRMMPTVSPRAHRRTPCTPYGRDSFFDDGAETPNPCGNDGVGDELMEGTLIPTKPSDLLAVDPKPRELYGDFSLVHLTAYSVYWLNAWDIPTTYENVSVLNARLFPADFGMTGFPELPDANRTNRSLLQMRPKYRGFATSDPRKGVHLTDKGAREVARLIAAIGPPSFEGKPIEVDKTVVDPRRPAPGKERTSTPAQILEEKRSKLLYRRYAEDRLDETDVVHFLGFLGLYDHTPPPELKKEFQRIRNAADEVNDREFLDFLDAVVNKFGDYLNRTRQTA